MTIKIDHGIPVPPSRPVSKWEPILRAMKTGDSFVVPKLFECQAILRVAMKSGLIVTTRKLNGDGWRVWRIKKPIKRSEVPGFH